MDTHRCEICHGVKEAEDRSTEEIMLIVMAGLMFNFAVGGVEKVAALCGHMCVEHQRSLGSLIQWMAKEAGADIGEIRRKLLATAWVH